MASFSELANLSADEVAFGRIAGLASFESSTLAITSALRLASSEKLAIAVLLARHGESFRAGSF